MKSWAVLVLSLMAASSFGLGETIERYALMSGSNLGGRGTAALKYASGDAKRFHDVMVKLGGVKEENSLVLVNPGKESMLQGLNFLASKIRKNRTEDRQVQFLFYYSGHSDERSLLLGGEHLDYEDLKKALDDVKAEVQIVVLDSCSSGAFTRSKGGQIGAPFLHDLSTQVEGHAFLTSSTAEELSQESDRIESSFFTHALLEGLRGAADANGDGKVTLNEAYEYAYGQTTANTQSTRSGTQHPAFDIQLNGKGTLVMTDLRTGGATLVFPKDMQGHLTVRDISNRLLAEIQKNPQQELVLGIDEGYYKISWEDQGNLQEMTALIDERREYPILVNLFQTVKKTVNRTRGPEENRLDWVPIGLKVQDPEATDLFVLNFLGGQAGSFEGWMLSLGYNRAVGPSMGFQGSLFSNSVVGSFSGMQGSFGVNLVEGDVVGLQNGWIFNNADGDLSGLQWGAVNRVAKTLDLGQVGILNMARNGSFFQVGAWNQTLETFRGLQLGLVANIANQLTGLQVGVFNYSEDQKGVQIGLVNVSKKLDGFPLGLIDIQFNGQNHLDQVFGFTGTSWESLNRDIQSTTLLRLGSEYLYKYIGFSTRLAYTHQNEVLPALGFSAGLGLRLPVFFPGFALHLDGGTTYTRDEFQLDFRSDPQIWHRFVPNFRTFATWSFWPPFGAMAGWDHPVFTKYFHPQATGDNKLEVRTDWGTLWVASRFFLGIQL